MIGIAFFAGVGITAVGPGGIFLTIGLFALSGLSPAGVAGTASAVMIAAGLVGTIAYVHSGELKELLNRQLAMILSASGMLGALLGSWVNSFVSTDGFGLLLGAVAFSNGIVILYQEWRGLKVVRGTHPSGWKGRSVLSLFGLGIGILSGLLGVGGPVLAVPGLVILGVPMLNAVAVAQAQSIAIAVFATAGYAARDAIEWSWVLLVGLPLVAGVLVGWQIARQVEPRKLKVTLGIVLLLLAPYLAF